VAWVVEAGNRRIRTDCAAAAVDLMRTESRLIVPQVTADLYDLESETGMVQLEFIWRSAIWTEVPLRLVEVRTG